MNFSDSTKAICPGASAQLVACQHFTKTQQKKPELVNDACHENKRKLQKNCKGHSMRGPRQNCGSFDKFVRVKMFCAIQTLLHSLVIYRS